MLPLLFRGRYVLMWELFLLGEKHTNILKHSNFNEQIELLISRNMDVKDKEDAVNILKHINYYKFKEFAEPFCSKENDNLNYRNIDFKFIVSRYYNDKNLRMNLLHAIEMIEVSVKTNLAFELGKGTLGTYGYLDFKNWSNREEYCKHYLADKSNSFKEKIFKYIKKGNYVEINRKLKESGEKYPPVWLTINILTFGDLVKLLELLSNKKMRSLLKNYGNITKDEFISWMKCLNLVRNMCAHNSNIKDLKLKTKPKIHSNWERFLFEKNGEIFANRLAVVLCIIDKFIEEIDTNYNFNSIKTSIDSITSKVDEYSKMLGFKNYSVINEMYKGKTKRKRHKRSTIKHR